MVGELFFLTIVVAFAASIGYWTALARFHSAAAEMFRMLGDTIEREHRLTTAEDWHEAWEATLGRLH